MTNNDLIKGIESGSIKINKNDNKNDFIKCFKATFRDFSKVGNNTISYKKSDSFVELDTPDYILVLKEGNPHIVLNQYELSNTFKIENIIILPGHDSIICYNITTEEITNHMIR